MNKQTWSLTSWDLESGRETGIQVTHIKYITANFEHFEGTGEGAMIKGRRDSFLLGDHVRGGLFKEVVLKRDLK